MKCTDCNGDGQHTHETGLVTRCFLCDGTGIIPGKRCTTCDGVGFTRPATASIWPMCEVCKGTGESTGADCLSDNSALPAK